MYYKEKQERIWDSLENVLKLTLRYLEQTNPHTKFAFLKVNLTPAQWKTHVYQWDKIKDNLEHSFEEIKEYKRKDDKNIGELRKRDYHFSKKKGKNNRDLGEITELSYELRDKKKDKIKK
jgi:hypothetical protein